MKLKPLYDSILFTWLDADEVEYVLESGIILQRSLDAHRERWGKVIAVGPLSTAKVGEYILPDRHVEPYGAKHPEASQDVRNSTTDVWRVRDNDVLCVTDDYHMTKPMNSDRKHTKVTDWETLDYDINSSRK